MGKRCTGPGVGTSTYAYDLSGNTLIRPGRTLSGDAEGHLATSTQAGAQTSYIYDAAGNRLIKRDPTGRSLYLA